MRVEPPGAGAGCRGAFPSVADDREFVPEDRAPPDKPGNGVAPVGETSHGCLDDAVFLRLARHGIPSPAVRILPAGAIRRELTEPLGLILGRPPDPNEVHATRD